MDTYKPIPGYENLYSIDLYGNVYSHKRNRLLKWVMASPGYWSVTIRDEKGKRRLWRIHTLMMLTFIGPRPKNMVTLHIDDDRDNNSLSNLRYGSQKENRATTNWHMRRVPEEMKERISRLRNDGLTIIEIISETGLPYWTVYRYCSVCAR